MRAGLVATTFGLSAALALGGCSGSYGVGNTGSASSSGVAIGSAASANVPVASGATAATPMGAPTLASVDATLAPVMARYQQRCSSGDQTACAVGANLQGQSNQLRQWSAACSGGDRNACDLYARTAQGILAMPEVMGGGAMTAPTAPSPTSGANDGGSRSLPQAQAQQIQAAAGALRRAIGEARQRCQSGDQSACAQGQQLVNIQQGLFRLFQACSGGDQAACAQHDRAVAQIVAAAQSPQSPAAAPPTGAASGFSQQ